MGLLTSPTLTKLLTNVRNLLGQPNPTNSTWSDLELTEYINEGVRMYFALVVKNSEGYFMPTPVLLDLTANSETVALPSDFFEARAVFISRSNGWQILEYRNDITSGFISTTGGSSGSNTYSPLYYFQGNNLVFHPTPNFSQTGAIRLEYIQFPDQMINGGDSMTNQVSPVFKQVIEMYAVKKAKLKQSMANGVNMVAIPQGELAELAVALMNTINKRSQYPEFIVPFNPEGFY